MDEGGGSAGVGGDRGSGGIAAIPSGAGGVAASVGGERGSLGIAAVLGGRAGVGAGDECEQASGPSDRGCSCAYGSASNIIGLNPIVRENVCAAETGNDRSQCNQCPAEQSSGTSFRFQGLHSSCDLVMVLL